MRFKMGFAALCITGFLVMTPLVEAQEEIDNAPPAADEFDMPQTFEEYDDGDKDYYDPAVVPDLVAAKKAHRAYLDNKSLQLERPERALTPPPPPQPEIEPPNWLNALIGFFESLAPLLRILFWGVIALTVLGIAWFIIQETFGANIGFRRKVGKSKSDDVLIDVRPNADEARSLLEEADALARAGRFAEAVHLLLFRSINDIQKRLDGGVPKSFTAREIGDMEKLPNTARKALGPIIRIVEGSHFGGRAVDQTSWTQARACYEAFAFGSDWA